MDVTLSLCLVLFTSCLLTLFRWALKRRSSLRLFRQYGIPGPEPSFLLGNMALFRRGVRSDLVIEELLHKHGNVFGYYLGGIPFVVVNDLDMLKQIYIKDFSVFSNRPPMVLNVKPITETILALKDKRWKEVRSILTPTFSSGKIKLMMSIFEKKVAITDEIVSKYADESAMFDIYQLVQGLTLDVIADCALAMKTHCQENTRDSFLIAVQDYFRYAANRAMILTIIFPFFGTLMTFVSNYLTSGQMTEQIVRNVKHAIDVRRKDSDAGAARSVDILQLMLDSEEKDASGKDMGMTDEEIIANAFVFLLAGYETTATALAFTFYLLIKHPDIQSKLYEEIQQTPDATYTNVQGLQYLDQVLSESMRYYPPVTGFVTRHCDADHQVGDFMIPKGANVFAPVWDIHHNPDYWPDPWTFDPDRFSPENKANINTMAYMPFGMGRRNCIGARFAQLEAKLVIFELVKKFRFEMCEKTDDPLPLICTTVIINPANGIFLRAIRR